MNSGSTESNPRGAGLGGEVAAPGGTAVAEEDAAPATNGDPGPEKARSLAGDAWRDLRRNPVFLISSGIVLVLIVMAAFPSLFTNADPRYCNLQFSRQAPGDGSLLGYDLQGCDIYARTVYGARASILVGVFATVVVCVVGSLIGMFAGFYGRWVDALLSRFTDIFFAIPLLLGAIIVLATFPSGQGTAEWVTIAKVVLALGVLGWTSVTRIMRSTVIQVKQADYVQAARALGGGTRRILMRHVLPNAMAPVIVYATITLGVFIGVEATLSFLGIGLQPPVISWGIAINSAQDYVRQSPHMLLIPSAFLSVTVLAFIMLGDAVRDAFDPKLR
ncbi:oligopeptide transport system permease protein [Haloactinopolyspora alba]|uniref:Oligopeptide transport system permease protein n=1 Tax=Haloactinopolyspora alba TaxID=648780 RepID=A0A2P8DX79_9ACTN|nr:ABC transporter permease [Haloactinopolyspora alba]PSL01830.1 oligopeptide transport system permease protein [Haloactinopolyspora alba]